MYVTMFNTLKSSSRSANVDKTTTTSLSIFQNLEIKNFTRNSQVAKAI